MCVRCFGLVVSTCHVIDFFKDSSEDACWHQVDYLYKEQIDEYFCVIFQFSFFCVCLSLALHNIIHMCMA